MEIWRDIKEFNSEYQISNLGRIKSKYKELVKSNGVKYTRQSKILTPSVSGGYVKGAVSIDGVMIPYRIHRLVAKAFILNKESKPEVNHIDGNKENNNVDNLEWCTRQENIQHCIDNNLQYVLKGSEIGNSILTEEDVLSIRMEFKPRVVTRVYLAKKYNVSEATIKDVIYRRTWKHI